jgi:hypothetical protein
VEDPRSVHDEAERASEPKVPFFEEVASPPGVGAHFVGGTTTFPVPAGGGKGEGNPRRRFYEPRPPVTFR